MDFDYSVQRFGDSGVIDCGVVGIGSLVEGEAVCSYLQLFPADMRYGVWCQLGDTPDVDAVVAALPAKPVGLPWRLVDTMWGVQLVVSFQRKAPPVGWQKATAAAADGRFGLPSLAAMEFADGYCYLAGVNPVLRAHAATVFGAFPSVARLAGYLSPDAMFSKSGGVVHLVKPGRAPPASTAPHNVGRVDNGGFAAIAATRKHDLARGYKLVDAIDQSVSQSSRVAVGAKARMPADREVVPAVVGQDETCVVCGHLVPGVVCSACELRGCSAVDYDFTVSSPGCARPPTLDEPAKAMVTSYMQSLMTYCGLDVPMVVCMWGNRPAGLASGCCEWDEQPLSPPVLDRDRCWYLPVHRCTSRAAHVFTRSGWWAIELKPGECLFNGRVEVLADEHGAVLVGVGPQVWSYEGQRSHLAIRSFAEASYKQFLFTRAGLGPSSRLRKFCTIYGLDALYVPHGGYTTSNFIDSRCADASSVFGRADWSACHTGAYKATRSGGFTLPGGLVGCVFDSRLGALSLDCGVVIRDGFMLGLAPHMPELGWCVHGTLGPAGPACAFAYVVSAAEESALEVACRAGAAADWHAIPSLRRRLENVTVRQFDRSQPVGDFNYLDYMGDDAVILAPRGVGG